MSSVDLAYQTPSVTQHLSEARNLIAMPNWLAAFYHHVGTTRFSKKNLPMSRTSRTGYTSLDSPAPISTTHTLQLNNSTWSLWFVRLWLVLHNSEVARHPTAAWGITKMRHDDLQSNTPKKLRTPGSWPAWGSLGRFDMLLCPTSAIASGDRGAAQPIFILPVATTWVWQRIDTFLPVTLPTACNTQSTRT